MRSPLNGAETPTGAHPGNTGGKKGRSGRKPDAFKAFMRSLVSHDDVADALRTVLANPGHPGFVSAFKMAAEFGYGRASQAVQLTGENGAAMELRVVHEVVDPTPPDAA
jgi:hypothetical protein